LWDFLLFTRVGARRGQRDAARAGVGRASGLSGIAAQTPSGIAAQIPSGSAVATPSDVGAETPSGIARTPSGIAAPPSGTAVAPPSGTAVETPSGTAVETPSAVAAETPSGIAQTPSGTTVETPSGIAPESPSGIAAPRNTDTRLAGSNATVHLCDHLKGEKGVGMVSWPSPEIILLQGFFLRVNHPFIAPAPPALPTRLHYYCTLVGQYTTPLPTSRLYAVHHTILVMTISRKGQVVS